MGLDGEPLSVVNTDHELADDAQIFEVLPR